MAVRIVRTFRNSVPAPIGRRPPSREDAAANRFRSVVSSGRAFVKHPKKMPHINAIANRLGGVTSGARVATSSSGVRK